MAKTLVGRKEANPRALVSRILEDSALVSAVQALPPAALLRLIDHVGLEDAGELVALATVDQLCRVFDEDVWQSARPGEDERFDPDRFTLWLEVMLEGGERFAADKLAALPEDLVELALHHHIMVISLQELALLISEGEGQVPLEKVVEDSPYLELGDYCVIARRHDGWDAIVTVLLALDDRHSNLLQPMLERLWRVTNEWIYGQGGLYQVLTSAEMLEADLDDGGGRDQEHRREERAAHLLARLSCDVLFRVGWRLLRDEVARPATAAVERVATRLATAGDDAQERAAAERLAATARAAQKEGRPAALASRLDVLAGSIADAQLELLAALTDDIPALRAPDGAREPIASVAHLRRARSFLDGL